MRIEPFDCTFFILYWRLLTEFQQPGNKRFFMPMQRALVLVTHTLTHAHAYEDTQTIAITQI